LFNNLGSQGKQLLKRTKREVVYKGKAVDLLRIALGVDSVDIIKMEPPIKLELIAETHPKVDAMVTDVCPSVKFRDRNSRLTTQPPIALGIKKKLAGIAPVKTQIIVSS
jgi:hypothetical protein